MPLLDVEDLLSKLTVDEKISLLSGKDFWHTNPVPRLKIPSIRVSDGPNGVRGTKFFNGVPAACFPCGTGLGATWDVDLIRAGGELMGREAIAKGASVILGPTVNIQRSPLGGRGFESFSEDPFLSGTLATATIKGIQSTGVGATIKHFVCNDQEHERQAVSAVVSERALREIYLMPFQLAIKEGSEDRPWAVMTSYNRVNGVHCSEDKRLIGDILRGEWGWKGLTMSDWFGTYSTTNALKAGLDLEMPGPGRKRGEQATIAIGCGKLTERTIDERVRNLFDLINKVEKAGVKENAEEEGRNTKDTADMLRKVASASIVLLKNEGKVLPFDKNKKVAVIGPNAKIAAYSGGGSATLRPYYAVTPYDGIKAQARDVGYAFGAAGHRFLPLLSQIVKTSDGRPGFIAKTYAQPYLAKDRKAVEEIYIDQSELVLIDYEPPNIEGDTFYMDLEALLTPEEDGEYEFGLSVCGTAKLLVDGDCVIDNSTNQIPGGTFFGAGTREEVGWMKLQAGKTYKIILHFGSAFTSDMKVPGVPPMHGGGFKIGGMRKMDPKVEIEKAVQLAKEVDQVVIIAGLNSDWECEGFDREHISLPGLSDTLISEVSAANPRTTVVIQSGTPVSMPWASSVSSIIQAWYGGNETGNAIADVLFGAYNPSGKLPLSFPHRNEDNPAFLNFKSERGRAIYGEDVYVGYRFYEKTKKEVLWPFGWGLSYSSFEIRNLKVDVVDPSLDGIVKVTVDITNTGSVAGAEVVQAYVSQRSPSINRAPKELKGFSKVFLEPRESKKVEMSIALKYAASFWDEERDMWILEKDTYDILVGNSSADTPLKACFDVETTGWWKGL